MKEKDNAPKQQWLISHDAGWFNPLTGTTHRHKPALKSHPTGSIIKRFDGRRYLVLENGSIIKQ